MKKKVTILSIITIIGCIGIASGLIILNQKNGKPDKTDDSASVHKLRSLIYETRSISKKITIGAVGDILIHPSVYEDAFNGVHYNFDPMLEQVKPLLEKPDILTANKESMMGGVELGLSGYPLFNSPHEVAEALIHNGVDIVSTANNHSLDRSEEGIKSESAYLNSLGLLHVGSFVNKQDQQQLRIINKNGIKLAFLAYTYGTNGIPIPSGKDYLVNIINREKMKEEIARARKAADVVVLSIHWGNEYQRIPTKAQVDLASFLANEGVDIIFGSHPHVLEPMTWIKSANGRKTFVIYSLGNFISGQAGPYKDIGGLVTIDITKHITENGSYIELSNSVFYPTYVSNQNAQHFRVVSLEKAGKYGLLHADVKYKEIQEHMYQWIR